MTVKADLDNDIWLWFSVRLQRLLDQSHYWLKQKAISHEFQQVETCAFFIGYPRSGHSIYGSILDAHPDMLVSHRLDALSCLGSRMDVNKLSYLIKRNSERFAKNNRLLTGYEYKINTGWQGKYRQLKAVADQEGKRTTMALGQHPELLENLLENQTANIKFIHITRNPFDNIATWSRRMGRSLVYTSDKYLQLCQYNQKIIQRLPTHQVLTLKHEDLIADTQATLCSLLSFLNLEHSDSFIEICSKSLYHNPNQSRLKVNWPPELIEFLGHKLKDFEFMRDYQFNGQLELSV